MSRHTLKPYCRVTRCDSHGGPGVQVAPDGAEVALEYLHSDPILTSSATLTTLPLQWANAAAAGPAQVALQAGLVYGFSRDSAWFLIAVRTELSLDMYGSQGPQLITAQGVASAPSPSLASLRAPPAAFTPDSRTVLGDHASGAAASLQHKTAVGISRRDQSCGDMLLPPCRGLDFRILVTNIRHGTVNFPPIRVTVFGNTHTRPDCTHVEPVLIVMESDPESGFPRGS